MPACYIQPHLLVHFQLHKEKAEAIDKVLLENKDRLLFSPTVLFQKVHKSVMELQHFSILDLVFTNSLTILAF